MLIKSYVKYEVLKRGAWTPWCAWPPRADVNSAHSAAEFVGVGGDGHVTSGPAADERGRGRVHWAWPRRYWRACKSAPSRPRKKLDGSRAPAPRSHKKLRCTTTNLKKMPLFPPRRAHADIAGPCRDSSRFFIDAKTDGQESGRRDRSLLRIPAARTHDRPATP